MSAVVGRVPELGKEWLEVAPELREFLTKLAQIVSNPDESAADIGVALSFFMASSAMEAAGVSNGPGAPITAEYLVGASDGTLVAERVVTDTTDVVWDLTSAGQAKAFVGLIQFAQVDGLEAEFLAIDAEIAALEAADIIRAPDSDQMILASRIFGG